MFWWGVRFHNARGENEIGWDWKGRRNGRQESQAGKGTSDARGKKRERKLRIEDRGKKSPKRPEL